MTLYIAVNCEFVDFCHFSFGKKRYPKNTNIAKSVICLSTALGKICSSFFSTHSSVFCCFFLFYLISVSTSFFKFLLISFPNSSSLQHFLFLLLFFFFFLLLYFLSLFPAFISSSSSYIGFYFLSDSLFSTLFLFYGVFISKGWKRVSRERKANNLRSAWRSAFYCYFDFAFLAEKYFRWNWLYYFPILSLTYLHFKTRHKFEQSLKLKKCTNKTYCVVLWWKYFFK